MTDEWGKERLDKNPYLMLPIIANAGKEVFAELNRKWDALLAFHYSKKGCEYVLSLLNLVPLKSTRQKTFIMLGILDRLAIVCMK